uniref:Uncharacterized protein n=1 Tax=viral metagenome TaxID=1070528 RepID=A0A6H1ZZR7_9ZZZZ
MTDFKNILITCDPSDEMRHGGEIKLSSDDLIIYQVHEKQMEPIAGFIWDYIKSRKKK